MAAMLSAALRPKAEMRLKALMTKHAYPSPYEDQIDGGAMYCDLKNLRGTLNSEEQEDICFAAYIYMRDNPLPSNATAQQFADRCNEFENEINPNLAVKVEGQEYVKLLLRFPPAELSADVRNIRCALEVASKMDDVAECRVEIKKLFTCVRVTARARRPTCSLPSKQ